MIQCSQTGVISKSSDEYLNEVFKNYLESDDTGNSQMES